MTNFLDPEYWRTMGIEPIVINPADDESINEGFAQLDQAIREEIEQTQHDTQQENQ